MNAMVVPSRGVIFQTQKEDKVIELIEYAKCLYRNQDPRLQAAFPLSKPLDQQPADRLDFAHGGYILGIPGGRTRSAPITRGATSTTRAPSKPMPVSATTKRFLQ